MNAENASPRNVPFRYAMLLAFALFLGFAAHLLFLRDDWLRALFSDFFSASASLLAALALWYGAWHSRACSRRLALGWATIGLAVFFWAVGDLSYAILEVGLRESPFPSASDLLHLAYYPTFLAGVLYLPASRLEPGERLRLILDLGIVMLASMLVLLNFFIGPVIIAGKMNSLLTEILALAYPVFDFVLLTTLLALLHRRETSRQGPLLLLGGSAVLLIASDALFGYQWVADSYVSGGVADLGYVASSLLAALAGVAQARDVRQAVTAGVTPTLAEESIGRAVAFWRLALPYAWFGGAFALLVWTHNNPAAVDFSAVAAGVGCIILLVVTRQFLALRENAALYVRLRAELAARERTDQELRAAQGALERKVAERTAELSAANQHLQQEMRERERAEAERRGLEARVQQTQKLESLGVLAGGIAHDFNNLLAVILGNTDLVQRDLGPGAPGRESIQEIEKAALRAAKLTNQMLCYSGKSVFVLQVVTLTDIIEGIRRLLEVSVSQKAALLFDLARDLPPVEADLTQVRQVILDLVINASEAIGGASGQITIRTGHLNCSRADLVEFPSDEEVAEGEYAYVEIADTGCGMSPAVKARLFEPFFTTKFTGRGLGLAAVLGIVRGHHGAIKVSTEVGYGSAFRVLFPACRKYGDGTPLPLPQPAPARAADSRKSVLVIDDEESLLPLCRQILERAGYDVFTAHNGQQGIALFREHADKIGLLIVDYSMPDLNGEQVFDQAWRISPGIKAVFSSGYSQDVMSDRLAEKGVVAYLPKPFTGKELIAAVRKVIGGPAVTAASVAASC